MKLVLLAYLLLFHGRVYGNNIFIPEDHCRLRTRWSFFNCLSLPRDGIEVKVNPPAISSTEDVFLKSLMVKNSLLVSFSCIATEDIQFSLVSNQGAFALNPNSDQLQEITYYSLVGEKNQGLKLETKIKPTATISSSCRVDIVSQTASLANLDSLRLYIDQMVTQLQLYGSLEQLMYPLDNGEISPFPPKSFIEDSLKVLLKNNQEMCLYYQQQFKRAYLLAADDRKQALVDLYMGVNLVDAKSLSVLGQDSFCHHDLSLIENATPVSGLFGQLQANKVMLISMIDELSSIEATGDKNKMRDSLVAIVSAARQQYRLKLTEVDDFLKAESQRLGENAAAILTDLSTFIEQKLSTMEISQ